MRERESSSQRRTCAASFSWLLDRFSNIARICCISGEDMVEVVVGRDKNVRGVCGVIGAVGKGDCRRLSYGGRPSDVCTGEDIG
jgi:hypothetical protein